MITFPTLLAAHFLPSRVLYSGPIRGVSVKLLDNRRIRHMHGVHHGRTTAKEKVEKGSY